MARAQKQQIVRRRRTRGTLVSVDGVSAGAVARLAKRLKSDNRDAQAGISWWDASGIFGDIEAARTEMDPPSARTLLLLYAADLMFRVRWEIAPALAEGRTVIAAPYVDTAIAFGRASGIEEAWLRDMFNFAPSSTESRHVSEPPGPGRGGQGFMEFASRRLIGMDSRSARQDLFTRMHARLKATRSR